MDMTEKNGQPSMEEILASIRRIIAEEPADAISLDFKPRTGPAPGNGAEHLSVDDSADFELPSMFRASIAAEKPAAPAKLMDALRATPQLDPATGTRSQPEFPMPSGFSQGTETGREAGRNDPSLAAHQALSSLKPAPRNDATGSDTAASPLNSLAVPAVEAVAADSLADLLWAAEPATETNAASSAPGFTETPVARTMVPFKDQHFSRMFGGPAKPAPVPAPELNKTVPVEPVIAHAPQTASTSFATLAAQSSAVPPPLNSHAATYTGQPPSLPAAQISPVAAAGGAIEDATAELLRPMLRQWLSDNMPRMVEKALHIEVAESVKPGKKPGSI